MKFLSPVRQRFPVSTLAATTLLLFLGTASGYAQELVQYEFTGVVTDNSGNLGVFGPFGTVQVNDTFSGRFSYMTGSGNPDQEMGDPELGGYDIDDFVIHQAVVEVTPLAVVVTHKPGLPTLPPLPADLGTDGIGIFGSYELGGETKSVALRLEAPYATVFADDSLPTSLTLGDFSDTQVVRSIRVLGIPPSGMSFLDEGQLTSLLMVPESSSLGLVLVGLSCIHLIRRRRLRGIN